MSVIVMVLLHTLANIVQYIANPEGEPLTGTPPVRLKQKMQNKQHSCLFWASASIENRGGYYTVPCSHIYKSGYMLLCGGVCVITVLLLYDT